ncbi:transaldolase family protein [Cellulosilyticum sp. I15G10I2]|uniref:transaldolase family protein n=1 Tax=Cellulosilyticum sp. I15G10I2 TaxID=1892843 RepID=UPI00085CD12D|nr:transaldolase family protein [Cellulosilyticum sp. I15G10I2]
MRIYIDTANTSDIKRIITKFPVDGVTTNPSLLAREKMNPMAQLKKIISLLEKDMEIHAQVLSSSAEDMIIEADYMRRQLGEQIFIKVPVTHEGIKAMKELSKAGFNLTATAIYTPMQAVMAAKAGARWTAPYVNRLDMIGANGVQVAIDIHNILTQMKGKTGLLAASFKNVEQILKLAEAGAGAVTVAPELLEQFLYHPLTEKAVTDFTNDFECITAKGATMKGL